MVAPITCHILDTTLGSPAKNVLCEISYLQGSQELPVGTSSTDNDGRVKSWVSHTNNSIIKFTDGEWMEQDLKAGIYKIRFHTSDYFKASNRNTFFPFVDIVFEVPTNFDKHYHVPLLLSNYGYSTYRGS